MKLLLDTHVAVWSVFEPERIRSEVLTLILSNETTLLFSVASLWELGIKYALGKTDFEADPRLLRGALLERGDQELLVSSEHVFGIITLPLLHRDPFDRLLVSQAMSEGAVLITADDLMMSYPGATLRA